MSRNKRPRQQFEDRFTGINHSLLNSPAYIALDYSDRALFIDLRMRLNGTNNGNISAALSVLKHRGWASAATLSKCLRHLEAAGFIAKTRETVGVEHGSKVCNLYRFTDVEVFEQSKLGIDSRPATNDFKAHKTLAEAKHAVENSWPTKKKAGLQELKRHGSETEELMSLGASEIEVCQPRRLQILKRQKGTHVTQLQ